MIFPSQAVIARGLIMLLQMAKLVADDEVDAFARRFDQVRIQKDDARRGAASPLFLHVHQPPCWRLAEPVDAIDDFIKPSGEYVGGTIPVPCGKTFPYRGRSSAIIS